MQQTHLLNKIDGVKRTSLPAKKLRDTLHCPMRRVKGACSKSLIRSHYDLTQVEQVCFRELQSALQ